MNDKLHDDEFKELLQQTLEDDRPGDQLEDQVMLAVHEIEEKKRSVEKYRRYAWVSFSIACVFLLLITVLPDIADIISNFETHPEVFIAIVCIGVILTMLIDSLTSKPTPSRQSKVKLM